MVAEFNELLGVDYGAARIGVARINTSALLVEPLQTISVEKDDPFQVLLTIINQNGTDAVVVGVARGLDGQSTAQTEACLGFARELQEHTELPVYIIDEAGTSVEARELQNQGDKGSVDSLAAGIILKTFISQKHQLRERVAL